MDAASRISDQLYTSYDQVPYPSHPYPQSHPNNLSTIARLFGLRPAQVDRCRVLEIGCAAGGNLIPMADCFPESEFVGIDLSRVQLAEGEQLINKAGLANIKLHHLSIADLNKDFGTFDYIICHGVYSWVSSALQERILAACSELLGPQGVAYVSYNTYPGWHLRGICRSMMAYHSGRYEDPGTRVSQARAFLDFMAQSIPDQDSAYGTLLKRELDLLRGQSDSYLYHDHLEDVNEPSYFFEFAKRAAGHRLQYLGEARLGIMSADEFPPHVQKTLKLLATDIIQMEQYLDFLRNRTFRQTLLCHEDVSVSRTLDWTRLRGLYVSADVRPTTESPELAAGKMESFTDAGGRTATSDHPCIKAALVILAKLWPQPVLFEELVQQCVEQVRKVGSYDRAHAQLVGEMLLQGYTTGGVHVQTGRPTFVTSVSNAPQAGLVARVQSQTSSVVANQRHTLVALDPIDSTVIQILDGRHDTDSIVRHIWGAFATGSLAPQPSGDREAVYNECTNLVSASLQRLAREALLIA